MVPVLCVRSARAALQTAVAGSGYVVALGSTLGPAEVASSARVLSSDRAGRGGCARSGPREGRGVDYPRAPEPGEGGRGGAVL